MAAVDALEITVLVLLWALTIWRFSTARSPLGRTVRLVVLLLAVSFTVNRREISYATDRILHVADVSVPLKNLATVAASVGMVHIVGLLSPDPDRYRWVRRATYGLLAAASVAMIALFLAVPRSPARWDFVAERAGTPLVTAYGLLAQLGLAVGLACALVIFRPSARRAAPGPLRVGLRLLTAGAVAGLLFMANRVLFQLTNAAGSTLLDGPVAVNVSRSLLATMLLLFVAGAAVPALGGLLRWASHYRALHRLRPMWQELTATVPGVVLGDPPGRLAELVAVRSVELRLYRRIIEIRDAQWRLAGGSAQAAPVGRHDLDGEVRELLKLRRAAPGGRPAARSVVATPDDVPSHNVPSDRPR
ncbi:hypothetical protein Drose_22905 [Dactylosporangium roseum]|uniref:DUF6545 domain-containing protein n=1 Tax=Dactylosporangium roseum TaxID=47989 RepID=A0ABY5YWG0_9ACTN|nr:MAB_1171c family putative transporter [Dactylosporangium roseum]UWZ34101.1 hypothetical protein Drose_22905 [Dactylosporangium roseum]